MACDFGTSGEINKDKVKRCEQSWTVNTERDDCVRFLFWDRWRFY